MSRDEAVAHLGTIAKSGTASFFQQLSGDQQKDSQLIGQFGVGFYSTFIVAERVEVFSRKAGAASSEGVRWESRGEGEFEVETVDVEQRGTRIVLHLKPDAKEFAEPHRLRGLIRRYSDHIGFPILMPKTGEATLEYETVNQAQALWTMPRSEIKDEEYKQFYQHLAHDFTEPLLWSHNRVEGRREYTSLLYIPGRAPFDLWQREAPRGLKLYVKRVFIMDDAEQFLPLYLRFVKGVLDSGDLPLNISREILQHDAEVEAIKGGLTKRVLEMLAKLAGDDAEKYRSFWKEFGTVLKEGVAEDPLNREKILPLLRFASTHDAADEPSVSLSDYRQRMKPDQEHIYFLVADSIAAARSSPYIEQLKEHGIEVLLLSDRIDAWITEQFDKFDGKHFKNAARGDLSLGKLETEFDRLRKETDLKESKGLLKRIKDALGERVSEVRIGTRLKDSPSCLVVGEHEPDSAMRRILEATGQKLPESKPILEMNVAHSLVKYLDNEKDADRFSELATLLYEQAALVEGDRISNPIDYVQRLNRLLIRLTGSTAIS
jgi:molecular chaperone HtpG